MSAFQDIQNKIIPDDIETCILEAANAGYKQTAENAAADYAALTEHNAELEKALEPFVEWNNYDATWDNGESVDIAVSVGDLRRAAAALHPQKEQR